MKILVQEFLKAGGKLTPLLLPSSDTNGTALFNPSVYVSGDKILCVIRHCQYTFYHSEKKKFEHEFGPLLYLNPENDITLTTTNYLTELDPRDYSVVKHTKIDTSKLDVKPRWDFVGLEDARLFEWDSKMYISGVRRDTTTNGQGRMELSEIVDGKEVSRWRIPAPGANDTYCEKNWMPVLDLPYHYVKWSNPTEIVRVDPDKKTCETVTIVPAPPADLDYRGGSQVIRVGNYYVALVHTVRLFKSEAGKKDAIYRHSILMWDTDWNLVKRVREFTFMNADVEFACGLAHVPWADEIVMTFGYSDNAAFALSIDAPTFVKFLEEADGE
jgi:predicted GH43/DUF377 family glycosyl hydrolase